MTYRKIDQALWEGDLANELRGDCEAWAVAIYLMTCPSSNAIGLYRIAMPTVSDDLGIAIGSASDRVRKLIRTGLIDFDDRYRMVWVKEMARHEWGEAPNVKSKQVLGLVRLMDGFAATGRKSALWADFRRRYSPGWDGVFDLMTIAIGSASDRHTIAIVSASRARVPGSGIRDPGSGKPDTGEDPPTAPQGGERVPDPKPLDLGAAEEGSPLGFAPRSSMTPPPRPRFEIEDRPPGDRSPPPSRSPGSESSVETAPPGRSTAQPEVRKQSPGAIPTEAEGRGESPGADQEPRGQAGQAEAPGVGLVEASIVTPRGSPEPGTATPDEPLARGLESPGDTTAGGRQTDEGPTPGDGCATNAAPEDVEVVGDLPGRASLPDDLGLKPQEAADAPRAAGEDDEATTKRRSSSPAPGPEPRYLVKAGTRGDEIIVHAEGAAVGGELRPSCGTRGTFGFPGTPGFPKLTAISPTTRRCARCFETTEHASARVEPKIVKVSGVEIPPELAAIGINRKSFEERVLNRVPAKPASAWQKELKRLVPLVDEVGADIVLEVWEDASASGWAGCTPRFVREAAAKSARSGNGGRARRPRPPVAGAAGRRPDSDNDEVPL